MPKRETTPKGAPCWVDLMSSDIAKSREFYTQLFGWDAEESNEEEYGGYFSFLKDGERIAGGMPAQPGMPDVWSIYLATDDTTKTVETAKTAGAHVVVDTMQVGEYGTMAFLVDPGGAPVGVWQAGTHKGSGIVGEAATPSWWELQTRDYDKVLGFYRDVFGWETTPVSDSPELRYTTVVEGDAQFAGVMDASAFLPEGVPSHWAVYFGVDDTDAALARITELGGSTVQPAEDTPYGRLATARDSIGATFKLVAPNEAMPAR